MENKVLLILIDGLRPDALAQCEHPFLYNFMKDSCSYSFNGQSVMPSITLPCHMSLFHSVTPDRHGTMNNTYVPPTHKLDGLCDILERQKKKCAFFYTWAQLRDLCRLGQFLGFLTQPVIAGLDPFDHIFIDQLANGIGVVPQCRKV